MTTLSVDALDLRAQPMTAPRFLMHGLTAICLLCALLGRLAYLIEPFNGDGAMFAYMGKLAAEGGQFGVDLIDNKFPTVGLVTSIFWKAFGGFWPGYVISQMLLAIVAALVLTRSAIRSFGEEARWATLLPALVLLNLNSAVMAGFQLETLQTFFTCLSAACALEALTSHDPRDSFTAGLCAGCATLVKPTGGAVLLALFLALVCHPGKPDLQVRVRIKLLCATLLGLSIPLLSALWWLIESNQLTLLPAIAHQISEYASSTSFDPLDLYRPLSLIFLFGAALLIRGWVYRRRAVESSANRSHWIFLIAWLALEFIGVLMQRRMYAYHFLPLAAPAVMIFGALPRRTTPAQLAGVLALPLLFGFWGSFDTIQTARANPPTWPAVTSWLKANTVPGDRVWRDITPYALLDTELRPASRIQITFIFMNSDDSPSRFSNMLIDDLNQSRPRYIVLPADVRGYVQHHTTHVAELSRIPARRDNFIRAWNDIESFVRMDYEPVKRIGDEMVWAHPQSLAKAHGTTATNE